MHASSYLNDFLINVPEGEAEPQYKSSYRELTSAEKFRTALQFNEQNEKRSNSNADKSRQRQAVFIQSDEAQQGGHKAGVEGDAAYVDILAYLSQGDEEEEEEEEEVPCTKKPPPQRLVINKKAIKKPPRSPKRPVEAPPPQPTSKPQQGEAAKSKLEVKPVNRAVKPKKDEKLKKDEKEKPKKEAKPRPKKEKKDDQGKAKKEKKDDQGKEKKEKEKKDKKEDQGKEKKKDIGKDKKKRDAPQKDAPAKRKKIGGVKPSVGLKQRHLKAVYRNYKEEIACFPVEEALRGLALPALQQHVKYSTELLAAVRSYASASTYITALHVYNELKDSVEMMIGRIADLEGKPLGEVHARFLKVQ